MIEKTSAIGGIGKLNPQPCPCHRDAFPSAIAATANMVAHPRCHATNMHRNTPRLIQLCANIVIAYAASRGNTKNRPPSPSPRRPKNPHSYPSGRASARTMGSQTKTVVNTVQAMMTPNKRLGRVGAFALFIGVPRSHCGLPHVRSVSAPRDRCKQVVAAPDARFKSRRSHQ